MTANLKPVDFKAVAAQGAYVYCYLREDGTPYYVGIAKTARRPFDRHSFHIPAEPQRIRLMRSGLTWEQACEWEAVYIKRYGRVDNGTGILRNLTDGGEGQCNPSTATRIKMSRASRGRKYSAEAKEKMSVAGKRKMQTPAPAQVRAQREFAQRSSLPRGPLSIEHREKLSKACAGRVLSPAQRKALTEYWIGRERSAEHNAKLSASLRGRKFSEAHKAALADHAKNRSAEHKASIKETRQRGIAVKYGVDPDWYLALEAKVQRKLCWRFSEGKRGAELLAGIA
jgi:hypothetical protein